MSHELNRVPTKICRKLAAGCSKHCFEVADRTDEVSSKHRFEVADRTDEVSNIYLRQGDVDVV
ncbi:hypothetical protein RK385_02905 [Streptococcus pneumoniae]|uniref:hypothetical protein n=1 Tax=Streptococcus pseudopneumoniae TaxID=257758 RepID=UPI000994433C|nr:hypothetical protein [Streptococcus pseudopneumoniae]MDG8837981.1 hypothetical protein [Streptococcus pneumoniae]MBF9676259.1 hypothetical protein [Streptococcus pseudopneumoniae]MDG9286950.1 hypothetical protein [Streptococcus pneumoniae]MDS2381247.1 hypothetical protein [Streptococcus pneumoniae]MDS2452899.1 hypothetical protein [Streptococcus pneumoniae]